MKFLEKILSLGLYLLAFLLPLQTRLFIRQGELNGGYSEYGTISLYVTDILLIALLFLYIIYRVRKKEKIIFENITYLIIGLNLVSLISVLAADDKLLSFYNYLRLTLGMGLFFLVSSSVYDRVKLLYAFVAGAVIQAVLGSWQFLSQMTIASKWLGLAAHPASVGGNSVIETLAGGRWLRAYGGLDHPNILGGYMSMAILIGFFLLIRKSEQKITKIQDTRYDDQTSNKFQITNKSHPFGNYLLLVACFLCLATLFFTFSRGAWVGLVVGSIVILAINIHTKNSQVLRRLLILGAASAVFAGILFFTYHDLVSTRLSGTGRLEVKSSQERTASYHDAVAIIKNNLFTGVGIGGYTRSLTRLYPSEPSWFYQPTHNVFLLVWAELGFIGLLLFATTIIYTFKNCYALCVTLYESAGDLNEGIIKLSIVSCLMILMLPDHYLWSLHFGVLFFWSMLGLAAGKGRWTNLTGVD